jgi:hypothetical protein
LTLRLLHCLHDAWRRLRPAAILLLALLSLSPVGLRAEGIELTSFELERGDDGVQLSYTAHFELSRHVEDALLKGVPLHFVAEVEVYRDRWYWRDKRIASASRSWRLAYQPLTRKYRVTFGGLNQSYDDLNDALNALRRVSGWKIAEPGQIDDGRHYVEFSFRLDTSQLPRPMQIGIGRLPDWTLTAERFQRLN